MEGGIKCLSTAARFSSSILVTFPWNKCCLLGFLVWEELKGRWEISVLFWDVGICSYREKSKETCKGPAQKVFSNMLWRGFVTVSVHSYICSLIRILRFFGGTYSKPFVSLTLPECGDFIFKSEVRESLLYDPWLVFSISYTDGSNSFSGFEIKSRKSLESVEGFFRKCMLRDSIGPVAFLCSLHCFLRNSEPGCQALFLFRCAWRSLSPGGLTSQADEVRTVYQDLILSDFEVSHCTGVIRVICWHEALWWDSVLCSQWGSKNCSWFLGCSWDMVDYLRVPAACQV